MIFCVSSAYLAVGSFS